MTDLVLAVSLMAVGVLAMRFNRPMGRCFAQAQGRVWDRFTKHWGFTFRDATSIGASQFTVFIIGAAAVAMGWIVLIVDLLRST